MLNLFGPNELNWLEQTVYDRPLMAAIVAFLMVFLFAVWVGDEVTS